jgi:adenine-specific DNA-methyltransferase
MPTLNWIGKDKVVNHHLDVPMRSLETRYTEGSTISNNKIIHGDNLEALKALLPMYEGKIKCIYIDPPYNTGNEGWVYNDNVNDPKIKKWLGQVVGKESEDLSRHDKWLCMMYPRLQLLKKLLAEDGAIFISIDDNEQAHLKLMCDEVFGSGNFINNIIWQKKYSPQNDAKYFSDMHDFVLCYSKTKSIWNRNLTARTEKQDKAYKNPDSDVRGVWKAADFSVKTYSSNYDYPITTPSGKIVNPPNGRSWTTSEDNFKNLVKDNRIWFGKNGENVPSSKKFLTEVQSGTVPITLWLREEVGDNQEGKQILKSIFASDSFPFDTPKPPRLIEKILQIATNPNDIILDSFAGSGTTAHAVLNLNKSDGGNRQFILIEMEEYAESITAERVRRVINGYGTTEGTGGDFAYCTLGERLFDDDGNIAPDAHIDALKAYVFYSETKTAMPLTEKGDPSVSDYFLGVHEGVAYYFFYERDATTTLNFDFLPHLKVHKATQYVIYADNCLLSAEFLQTHQLIFKKIPRDIAQL